MKRLLFFVSMAAFLQSDLVDNLSHNDRLEVERLNGFNKNLARKTLFDAALRADRPNYLAIRGNVLSKLDNLFADPGKIATEAELYRILSDINNQFSLGLNLPVVRRQGVRFADEAGGQLYQEYEVPSRHALRQLQEVEDVAGPSRAPEHEVHQEDQDEPDTTCTICCGEADHEHDDLIEASQLCRCTGSHTARFHKECLKQSLEFDPRCPVCRQPGKSFSLQLAFANKDIDGINAALQAGEDLGAFLSRPGVDQKDLLNWAIEEGHLNLVSQLLTAGVMANEYDYIALFEKIASENNVDMIDMFLATMPDQFKQSALNSALVGALSNGRLDLANRLVVDGANVITRDENRATLLHWAARSGSLGAIEWAMNIENLDKNSTDNQGNSALAYAAKSGNLDAFNELLRLGVALNGSELLAAANLGDLNMFNRVLEAEQNSGHNFANKEKALFAAVKSNNIDVVDALIRKGVNVEAAVAIENLPAVTALGLLGILAAREVGQLDSPNREAVIKRLVEAGANLDVSYPGQMATARDNLRIFGYRDI